MIHLHLKTLPISVQEFMKIHNTSYRSAHKTLGNLVKAGLAERKGKLYVRTEMGDKELLNFLEDVPDLKMEELDWPLPDFVRRISPNHLNIYKRITIMDFADKEEAIEFVENHLVTLFKLLQAFCIIADDTEAMEKVNEILTK